MMMQAIRAVKGTPIHEHEITEVNMFGKLEVEQYDDASHTSSEGHTDPRTRDN